MHVGPLRRFIALTLLLGMLGPSPVGAVVNDNISIYFNSGVVNSSYLGAKKGGLTSAKTVDAGAEVVTSSFSSFAVHGSFSLDPQTAIYRYVYAGFSNRYYFGSHAMKLPFSSTQGKIEIKPNRQYYLAIEGGFSQTVIDTVNESLSVLATSFEYGGTIGMVLPLSQGVGLGASISACKGLGISSVSVDSTIVKGMIGLMIR